MNEERKGALGNIIQRNGLAALIFWRPDELVLTLEYLPHWGVSFLVYTRQQEAILFVPEIEPEDILPEEITIVKFPWGILDRADRTIGAMDRIIDAADPWTSLYSKITAVLADRGLRQLPVAFVKSIGATAPCRMAGEQPPLPPDLTERLRTVSEGGFKDVSDELLALYSYKTADDLLSLELTHTVAGLAVATFYKNVRIGRTESFIAAAVESSVQEMTGREGVQFARAWATVQSGVNTAFGGIYNRTTGKTLAAGELVLLEIGICVNGYWADITRTVQTTELPDLQRRLFELVSEAQELAISIMRPGVSMGELDAVARNHITRAGFGHLFNHALGHQVGFRYHDPGATLSPGSNAVLREGMVLTVEPGIYGQEIQCGVRIEDNILITADGCRILSDYPRALAGQVIG